MGLNMNPTRSDATQERKPGARDHGGGWRPGPEATPSIEATPSPEARRTVSSSERRR